MKCDIIIPVWNQLDFTRKCIESVFKNTDYAFHLIIVDNGSNWPTKEHLDKLARDRKDAVTLIRNEKNLGFIKASNQGIRQSRASYVCFLNNDTQVSEGWLKEMIRVAEAEEDIGIVNPNSNTLGCKPKRAETLDSLTKRLKSYTGEWSELALATGFCMLVKRKVIQKVGLFDEIYGMGTFEDADFSKRAQGIGYLCVCARAAYVYHQERRSFIRFKRFNQDFNRNQQIFSSKWGRQERILYILTREDLSCIEKIVEESLISARKGNIVWIFLKKKDKKKIKKHSNIYTYSLPEHFFNLVSLWKILKRKKKFDRIYVDSENDKRRLNDLKNFHKAEVICAK